MSDPRHRDLYAAAYEEPQQTPNSATYALNSGAGRPEYAHHQDSYQSNMQPGQIYQQNDYTQSAEWDSRSTKSYNTYRTNTSQTHLNPHQMSQVTMAPPVPNNPYGQKDQLDYSQPDYPPQQPSYAKPGYTYPQRPGMHSASTGGYSTARDKLMKRRVRLYV